MSLKEKGSSKERFFYHNTLLCLVKALEGKSVTIDLRNDAYICGTIAHVDGFMNVSFVNAVYCNPVGEEYAFENIYIQSRNIRYVHIPENMSIKTLINDQLNKSVKVKPPNPVQKSRKVKKAMKQHLETVALLDT